MLNNSNRLRIRATGIESVQKLFSNFNITSLLENNEMVIKD